MQKQPFQIGLSKDKELMKLLREFQRSPGSLSFVALAEQYRKKGLLEQALEICDEGLRFHTDLSSALLVKARCFFDQRRYSDALNATAKIILQNPENLRAHKMRAEIFTLLGQRGAALTSLGTVLRLFPQDEEARKAFEELRGLQSTKDASVKAAERLSGAGALVSSVGKIDDFQVGNPAILEQWRGTNAPVEAVTQIAHEDAEAEEEPAIATRTIAELYLRQGLTLKARAVLKKMLRDNADNQWARETLQDIRSDGIVLPADREAAAKKQKLERKLQFLERLLTQVRLAPKV